MRVAARVQRVARASAAFSTAPARGSAPAEGHQGRAPYWPPRDVAFRCALGGRKEAVVFAGKREEDGQPEACLAILARGGDAAGAPTRLATFNAEELAELARILPRLQAYTELWGVTAERNRAKRRDVEEMQRLTDEGASGI